MTRLRRDSTAGAMHTGVILTSYCACRLRDFWLRKPNTLEKCSFRIWLKTCREHRSSQRWAPHSPASHSPQHRSTQSRRSPAA